MAVKRKASKQSTKSSKKPRSATPVNHDRALRQQLTESLTWDGAHVGWKAALADLPPFHVSSPRLSATSRSRRRRPSASTAILRLRVAFCPSPSTGNT